MPSGNFTYVFIPANDSKPIEAVSGDKSGGLSDDALSKEAKQYFFKNSDKGARAAALENASPEQRKLLAQQLRDEVKAQVDKSPYANQMLLLDDDALIGIMQTNQTSATCEITALTVPTPLNNHRAVSMYSDDNARTQNLAYNRRATELLVACGHSISSEPSPSRVSIGSAPPGGICGDAFVGRCHDDEVGDIWERVDFTVEDANPRAEWCDVARQPGGGGGGGGSAGGPRSLSGLMNQNAGAITDGGNNNGFDKGEGDGYSWSQNDEEVELRFPVAAGTKAKYVKVHFARTTLKVIVAGQTLVSGELGGTAEVEDSTFTIEDVGSKGRELCVTICKKEEGRTWPFVVR
jgi:hypothetical protein